MRIQYGGTVTVTAQELWLSEIQAGRAFFRGGRAEQQAALVGMVQLFNPAGSGRTLIVHRVLVSIGVQSWVQMARYDVALTFSSGPATNFLLGGAAGVGQVRNDTLAAPVGTELGRIDVLANSPVEVWRDWGWEIPPGAGIVTQLQVVNAKIAVLWEWREV